MFYRFPIISTGVLLLGAAAAAEMPVYEVSGLPITPHQVAVVGPANAEQSDYHFTYTLGGMPASAHQIVVLTLRAKPMGRQAFDTP
jgi:hypothetical protein